MSNSITDLIANLNTALFWINQIIPLVQIIFGTFGNLFNIIIFTRRSLRTNPCSIYFLAGSINNIFIIYVPLLTRYLSSSWYLDPSNTNTILCKLRLFFSYSSLSLILWFTTLASIDRFLSSSYNVRLRRLSSLPIAQKSVVSITIFMFLIHVHVLIFNKSDWSGNIISCGIFSSDYNIFFNLFTVVIYYIVPIILMSIFGILMILNVRYSHNRVTPQENNAQNERFRSNDRQLFIMLLFQVLITTLISIPFLIFNLYNTIAITILKYRLSISESVIYSFAFNFFRIVYYTNSIVGFYIYTLTSSRFRAELKRCIQFGLKFALTTIGIARCPLLRTQRALIDENQTDTNNLFLKRSARRSVVRDIQHQEAMINTSAV